MLESPAPSLDVPARVRSATLALLALLTLLSLLGVALAPYLLVNHPLALIALSPAGRHVVLAAPNVNSAALITIGTLRRLLMSVGMFGLGLLYGRAAIS